MDEKPRTRMVGVEPGACLVVEDALSGIAAGHAAGMDVAAVPTSFSRETLMKEAHPEYLLDRIADLQDLEQLK